METYSEWRFKSRSQWHGPTKRNIWNHGSYFQPTMCSSSCNHYTLTNNCNENENDLHSNQLSNMTLSEVRWFGSDDLFSFVGKCHSVSWSVVSVWFILWSIYVDRILYLSYMELIRWFDKAWTSWFISTLEPSHSFSLPELLQSAPGAIVLSHPCLSRHRLLLPWLCVTWRDKRYSRTGHSPILVERKQGIEDLWFI